MNSKAKPKQFLELHSKAIIIYTLEIFEQHTEIDAIVVVCVKGWIDYLKSLIEKAGIKKVKWVVPGGETGQMSIYNGLLAISEDPYVPYANTVVLIHDGVRPLIDERTISDNIASVKLNGTGVTVTPAIETVININANGEVEDVLDRNICRMAKAPQSFFLSDIMDAHKMAIKEGKKDFIDSASMMRHFGYVIYTVNGPLENIKITTPLDYYIFRAISDIKENAQIMGL